MSAWKEQFFNLVRYTKDLEKKFKEMELLFYKIDNTIQQAEFLDLKERNKTVLMRLKEDISLAVEYQGGLRNETIYKEGTLIQCGSDGHVYLDDDGDGNLYFPPNLLERVELNSNTINWNEVVMQG